MLYPLCFVSRIRRKAGGPVSQPFYVTNKLWDVKERTHCSQRVWHVVPGVVVYLDLCRRRSGWVRCDHNGLKRLPEAPLICWRPISPLWFLCNSALGCKWGNWHHSSPISHLSILEEYRSPLTGSPKDDPFHFPLTYCRQRSNMETDTSPNTLPTCSTISNKLFPAGMSQ